MPNNTLRIIGGSWRSRKIQFPSEAGLRPTSDRVRETVFNWLAPHISQARCLDLFAGSGALGLEALSRGAARVIFADHSHKVLQQLRANLNLLQAGAEQAITVLTRLPKDLALIAPYAPFDIVFLDPPFRQSLLPNCCLLIEQQQLLSPEAYIYLEAEAELKTLELPANWRLLKQKKSGQVAYYLAQRFTC